jgi:ABC-type sugar transport system ATPase subunit
MTRVELKGVDLQLGASRLFSNYGLEVEAGSLCALVGPSGCGKSTILRIIAGLQRIDAGLVMLGGRDVTALSTQARNIGFVFQSHGLYPHMTVRRNIAYALEIRGVPRAERWSKADRVAERLGLADLLDRKPHQLSGGQRQRVAIGRAIARDQKLILLDEPFASLDPDLRTTLRSELRSLQAEVGTTMIMVTHDLEDAAICSQVVDLGRGPRPTSTETLA